MAATSKSAHQSARVNGLAPVAAPAGLLTVTCPCGKTAKARPNKDGAPKVPKTWRRINDVLTCRDCAKKNYYTRAIRVEIRGVAPGEERTTNEFRQTLSKASSAAARFGNWYIQRLYAADLACAPTLEKTKDGKTKLPPMPDVDYYREAVKAFPELSGGGISGLAQMVKQWYGARRFDALIALNRSVESYRFGYLPVEVRKQDWKLLRDAEGKLTIRCSVNPGRSWTVSVYADVRGRSQLEQIEHGEAIPLACKIVRATKQPVAGSGAPPRKAWFFRISAMFPRKPRRQSHQEVTLTLGHDAEYLLFGAIDGSDEERHVYQSPGVTLKQLIVGGDKSDRAHQQEWSAARGIWSRRKVARWSKDRTRMCENRRRKIGKLIELEAAKLARWCVRSKVTSVDYETADRGFVPHFPWRQLRDKIAFALERESIGFAAIGSTNQEDSEALAGPGSETNGKV